ncbi:MAG: lipoprotein insertase outer membrane protein LolB [Gammaproteobacteria bacterium]
MRGLLLGLVVLLLSSACTTMAPPAGDDDVSWQAHRQQVAQLDFWTVTGRLAVSNGRESWHLSLTWKQQGPTYLIRLVGPLGAGQVQLRGDARGVLLDDGENPPVYADNANALLYQNTGLNIPVEGLRFWIRGLPDPQLASEEVQLLAGKLKQLQQGGWQLDYRGYQQVNHTALPKRLFMQRDDLDVRLVIDQWQLGLPNT